MEKIVCLKLLSGEEVAGKFVEKTDAATTLKEVASIVMMPGASQGQVGLGLMPFLPYAEEKTYKFNNAHVMVEFDPNVDMLNNYNRMFGSGIQIARSM
jgi:hypothetical protein